MEANHSEPAQRLWADDENAKMRILNIDLSDYDGLVTFPAGIDWPFERAKLRFLQTALRLDIPWGTVVQFTAPYFGQTLFCRGLPSLDTGAAQIWRSSSTPHCAISTPSCSHT
jgi:hypothetical protein